ncbi:MAG: pilus assembly protein [Bdellovibrionales bacterium]|nr:pilus assembly protein [Bdellovibrionales bacterium]
MKLAHRKRFTKEQSAGVAFFEFAISVPLLLTVTFGCIVLGQALWQYLSLAQVAFEVASYGAGVALTPGSSGPNHSNLQQFALDLLSASDREIESGSESVQTFYTYDPSTTRGEFTVTIRARINTLLPGWDIPMRVRSVSPHYLRPVSVASYNDPNNPPELFDCGGAKISGCASQCESGPIARCSSVSSCAPAGC